LSAAAAVLAMISRRPVRVVAGVVTHVKAARDKHSKAFNCPEGRIPCPPTLVLARSQKTVND
jgi:hypothetical protein